MIRISNADSESTQMGKANKMQDINRSLKVDDIPEMSANLNDASNLNEVSNLNDATGL
jgi:hypothetical protein